jgi:hypothetical protein
VVSRRRTPAHRLFIIANMLGWNELRASTRADWVWQAMRVARFGTTEVDASQPLMRDGGGNGRVTHKPAPVLAGIANWAVTEHQAAPAKAS